MTHSVSHKDWALLTRSVEASHHQAEALRAAVLRVVLAVQRRDRRALEKALQSGVSVDQLLTAGRASSPDSTTQRSHIATIEHVLESLGAEGSITALGAAAITNQVEFIQYLLDNWQAAVGQVCSGGKDAAWLAMENHAAEAFHLLMERGAYPSLRLPQTRYTRLISATLASDVDAVDYLLKERLSQPSERDAEGSTALHHNFAMDPYTEADLQIARLLIQYGAATMEVNNDGLTPISLISTLEQQDKLVEELGLSEEAMPEHEATTEPEVNPDVTSEPEVNPEETPLPRPHP